MSRFLGLACPPLYLGRRRRWVGAFLVGIVWASGVAFFGTFLGMCLVVARNPGTLEWRFMLPFVFWFFPGLLFWLISGLLARLWGRRPRMGAVVTWLTLIFMFFVLFMVFSPPSEPSGPVGFLAKPPIAAATGTGTRGFDLQLTRYDERDWRATFYTTGMEHSPTTATGTGWEHTPWHATQRAAWEALKRVSQAE